MKKIPNTFILDIDGVMTTGQFIYSKIGKEYKIFGAHDSDGLKMLKDKIISEDESKNNEKSIQKITDNQIKQIDITLEKKEKEIMSI